MSLQVLFALNQTLLQHESLRAGSLQAPYTTEDLIKHYNCGDLNAVIFNHDTSQVRNHSCYSVGIFNRVKISAEKGSIEMELRGGGVVDGWVGWIQVIQKD